MVHVIRHQRLLASKALVSQLIHLIKKPLHYMPKVEGDGDSRMDLVQQKKCMLTALGTPIQVQVSCLLAGRAVDEEVLQLKASHPRAHVENAAAWDVRPILLGYLCEVPFLMLL